ncbi:MAG: DUF2239 family protein [Pseudomonadota bacterium]
MTNESSYVAFAGERLVASGTLRDTLTASKAFVDSSPDPRLLIFEDQTGRQVDFNLQGSLAEVLERALPAPQRAGPGRPKLGVVSREVSLLPRHWAWLEEQPQGISAALRRLVDEAKKRDPDEQRARRAREAVSKLMTALAGNAEHYEEASRALFAKDNAQFSRLIRTWPKDVRQHLLRLLEAANAPEEGQR